MSSTSIIAKITEIYDRNIEFDQDFFKNETIRGIEHTVIKGKLTYIPDSCDHCNGENKVNKQWLPEVLGIDEFKSLKYVDSNMSVNLCDIQTGEIIDIVPDRRKRYLREYFESFSKEARSMVKYITTDMYQTYIDPSIHHT